jgi:hypothetical protein
MTPHGFLLTLGSTVLLTATLATAQVTVHGYTRKDGAVVEPYQRTRPDATPTNNYSYPGNLNPNSGQITGGDPYRPQAPAGREAVPMFPSPTVTSPWDSTAPGRR